jgi:hypothetical protein
LLGEVGRFAATTPLQTSPPTILPLALVIPIPPRLRSR